MPDWYVSFIDANILIILLVVYVGAAYFCFFPYLRVSNNKAERGDLGKSNAGTMFLFSGLIAVVIAMLGAVPFTIYGFHAFVFGGILCIVFRRQVDEFDAKLKDIVGKNDRPSQRTSTEERSTGRVIPDPPKKKSRVRDGWE